MKRFREQCYLLLGQGFALHELRNLLIEVSMRIRRHRIHVLVLHLLTLLVEVVLSISSLRIDGNPRSHSENPFRLFGLCLLFLVFRKRERERRVVVVKKPKRLGGFAMLILFDNHFFFGGKIEITNN